ncbi:MAG: hypothetical protein H7067_10330 [Burkholderiales bacterium]|nr:hypothetical protein [Opitutaceae bacterium]
MSLEGKDIINAAKKQPLVFACAVLLVVFLGFTYWRLGAVDTLQGQVDERLLVLQKTKANVTYSVQLDAQLKEFAEINQKIKASAFRPADLAQNQQMFYRLESETGVKLIDLRQQAPDKTPVKGAAVMTYTPVVFALTIEGDYRQLLAFTKRLESGPTLSRTSNALFIIGTNNVPSLSMTVQMLGLRQ